MTPTPREPRRPTRNSGAPREGPTSSSASSRARTPTRSAADWASRPHASHVGRGKSAIRATISAPRCRAFRGTGRGDGRRSRFARAARQGEGESEGECRGDVTQVERHRASRDEKAGDGTRTRDIQLGKLTLYQLSYTRNGAEYSGEQGRGGSGVDRPASTGRNRFTAARSTRRACASLCPALRRCVVAGLRAGHVRRRFARRGRSGALRL
jgi:hypothetical protein